MIIGHGPKHWVIAYQNITGIYRNFEGKVLHSYFTTVYSIVLLIIYT